MTTENQSIETEEQLIDQMTSPSPEVEEAVRALDGDIAILGISGKMGPTLGELLVRAGAPRVIGVARFSDPNVQADLEARGIETCKTDLLDDDALAALPDAPYVYLIAGHKFGSTGNESLTWAMNTLLPAKVMKRYADSKVVYVSSGNVYRFSEVDRGATENDPVDPIRRVCPVASGWRTGGRTPGFGTGYGAGHHSAVLRDRTPLRNSAPISGNAFWLVKTSI